MYRISKPTVLSDDDRQIVRQVACQVLLVPEWKVALDRLVQEVVRLFGAEAGVVFFPDPDGGQLVIQATYGVDAAGVQEIRRVVGLPVAGGGSEPAIKNGLDLLLPGSAGQGERAPSVRLRSLMAVPLEVGTDLTGQCVVLSRHDGHFGPRDRVRFTEVSRAVGWGLANHTIFSEVSKQIAGLSMVANLNRVLTHGESFRVIVAEIIDKVNQLLGTERAAIMLYDAASNELVMQYPGFGLDDPEKVRAYRVPLDGGGNAVRVFLSGESYYCNDIRNNNRFLQRFVELYHAQKNLTVPLAVEGRRIGVIHVIDKRDGDFTEQDVQLLQVLGSHLATLLENSLLNERERRRVRHLVRTNRVIRKQRDRLMRITEAHKTFTEQVLAGEGLAKVAETLTRLVGWPSVVQDQFFRPLAHGLVDDPDLGPLNDAARQGLRPVTPADREKQRLLALLKRDKKPLYLEPAPKCGMPSRRVVAPVILGQEIFGYVTVMVGRGRLGRLQMMAVEKAATACALEFMKIKTAAQVEQRLKGDFVHDLLAGISERTAAVTGRAAYLGLDLSRPHRVLIVSHNQPNPYGEAETGADSEYPLHLVRTCLADCTVSGAVVRKANTFVVIANLAGDDAARALGRQIVERLSFLTSLGPVNVGIGRACTEVEHFPHSYADAQRCLDIARVYAWSDRVILFADLGAERLLFRLAEDRAELAQFAETFLGRLAEYDDRRSSEFQHTLRTYLSHDSNLRQTAESLHIHINTLKYRLTKIAEITGLDLDDVETRFSLRLAFKALDLLQRD